jgi:hypothetical protein
VPVTVSPGPGRGGLAGEAEPVQTVSRTGYRLYGWPLGSWCAITPTILQVIRDQAAHTRRPPLTPRDLATLLGRADVPDIADQILRLIATPLDRS